MTAFLYIYNSLSVIFYLLQKQLYITLLSEGNSLDILKLLSLLSFGILTSVTPCFLSIIPLLISYINFFNLYLLRKIIFYLGLLSSFILIIAISYYGGNQFYNIFTRLPIFTASFFIILGFNMIGIYNFNININHLKLNSVSQFNILIQAYLLGYLIGLSALPCNASLILTVVLWLSHLDNHLESFIYLIIYTFGFLLPFIIMFYIPIHLVKMELFVYLWNLLITLLAFLILSTNFFILFQQIL